MRVTIYLPDYLHARWRDHHGDLNLSKLTQRALYEAMTDEGDADVVLLCDLCRRRAATPLRAERASKTPGMHAKGVSPAAAS